jgi:hypothetical protein
MLVKYLSGRVKLFIGNPLALLSAPCHSVQIPLILLSGMYGDQ